MADEILTQITSQFAAQNPALAQLGSQLGISIILLLVVLAIVSIWSLIWKGFALWKAARKTHKIWFIVLLIVNTIGILEILYIYVFSEMGKKNSSSDSKKPKRKR